MLIEFDQSTLARMTAALEFVCKQIPADQDSHDLRKRIADGMVAGARQGRRTLQEFKDAGFKILAELSQTPRSKSFRINWLRRAARTARIKKLAGIERRPRPRDHSQTRSET